VETGIPCSVGGDPVCPTGFHCGDAGRCTAGEEPPVVTFAEPAREAHVQGRLQVTARLRCATGVGETSLQLRPVAGTALDGSVSVTWQGDAREEGTLTGELETWQVPDGAAQVVVTAESAMPGLGRTEALLPVTVSNGTPVVGIQSPAADAEVAGLTVVTVQVTSAVPVVGVQARRSGDASWTAAQTWTPGQGEAGTAAIQLDLDAMTDGPLTLEVQATDAASHTGTASRTVTVANGVPRVTIDSPVDAASVSGVVTGHATVQSKVRLAQVTVKLGALAGTAVPAYGADHLSADVDFTLDAGAAAAGAAVLEVDAVDDAGRAGSATRNVTVRH
jgi:hypothetical protein